MSDLFSPEIVNAEQPPMEKEPSPKKDAFDLFSSDMKQATAEQNIGDLSGIEKKEDKAEIEGTSTSKQIEEGTTSKNEPTEAPTYTPKVWGMADLNPPAEPTPAVPSEQKKEEQAPEQPPAASSMFSFMTMKESTPAPVEAPEEKKAEEPAACERGSSPEKPQVSVQPANEP